jgi:hypothetical protein
MSALETTVLAMKSRSRRTSELKGVATRGAEREEGLRLFDDADSVRKAGQEKLGYLKGIATAATSPQTNRDMALREFKRKKRQQSQRGRTNRDLKKLQKMEMQREMAKESAEIRKRQAKEELAAQTLAELESRKGLSWEERQALCRLKRNKMKLRLADCRKELEELQNPSWGSINESIEEKKARERRLLDLWLAEMRMITELDDAEKELKQAKKEAAREKFRQKHQDKLAGMPQVETEEASDTESDDEGEFPTPPSYIASDFLGNAAKRVQYWYRVQAHRRRHHIRCRNALKIQHAARMRVQRSICRAAVRQEVKLQGEAATKIQKGFRGHTCHTEYRKSQASKVLARVFLEQKRIKAVREKQLKQLKKKRSIRDRWKKAGAIVVAAARAKKEIRRKMKAKARRCWVKAQRKVVGKLRAKKLAVHLSRLRQARREQAKALKLQAWFRACQTRKLMAKWFGYYGVKHLLPKRRTAIVQMMDMDNALNMSSVKCLGCGEVRELIVAGRCAICAKNKITLNSLNRVSSVHRKRLNLVDDDEGLSQEQIVQETNRKRDLAMAAVRGALTSYSHALEQMATLSKQSAVPAETSTEQGAGSASTALAADTRESPIRVAEEKTEDVAVEGAVAKVVATEAVQAKSKPAVMVTMGGSFSPRAAPPSKHVQDEREFRQSHSSGQDRNHTRKGAVLPNESRGGADKQTGISVVRPASDEDWRWISPTRPAVSPPSTTIGSSPGGRRRAVRKAKPTPVGPPLPTLSPPSPPLPFAPRRLAVH